MAHKLDKTLGRFAFAFTGDRKEIWHGEGHQLEENQPLDVWLKAAGLEWEARKASVQYAPEGDYILRNADKHVIYRSDTSGFLGICSDRYQIVQPATVAEFYRDLCEENGFQLNAMGALDAGQRVWATATVPMGFKLAGVDEVKTQLLLATSFDGSLATRAQLTSIRTVCSNTLGFAYNENKGVKAGVVTVPHSTGFNGHDVKISLGIYQDMVDTFAADCDKLASRIVKRSEAMDFIIRVILGDKAAEGIEKGTDLSTKGANICNDIFERFMGRAMGSNFASARGTAWGLVNAVTEYVDHEQGNNLNNRIKSAWFGKGADVKQDAMSRALALAA